MVDTIQAVTSSQEHPQRKAHASGFAKGSFLGYLAENISKNYHGNGNSKLFLHWMTLQLLLLLPDSSSHPQGCLRYTRGDFKVVSFHEVLSSRKKVHLYFST